MTGKRFDFQTFRADVDAAIKRSGESKASVARGSGVKRPALQEFLSGRTQQPKLDAIRLLGAYLKLDTARYSLPIEPTELEHNENDQDATGEDMAQGGELVIRLLKDLREIAEGQRREAEATRKAVEKLAESMERLAPPVSPDKKVSAG